MVPGEPRDGMGCGGRKWGDRHCFVAHPCLFLLLAGRAQILFRQQHAQPPMTNQASAWRELG